MRIPGSKRYQFISVTIVNQRYKQEFIEGEAKNRNVPFARSDLVLNSQDWASLIVGRISTWIDLDSPNEITRIMCEKSLDQELGYCYHLGLSAILLPLHGYNCVNLARFIYAKIMASFPNQGVNHIWIQVPLQAPEVANNALLQNGKEIDPDNLEKRLDTWEWWNKFRTLCNSEKKLSIALELCEDIPDQEILSRWLGEPISCVIIPTNIFISNKKGYPVLSKPHQQFVQKLFKLDVQVLIKGNDYHGNYLYYRQYMDHLWNNQPQDDTLASYAKGYEDYLQVPLQPLMDNLESSTYETFERDPIKYTEYREAMYHALVDRVKEEDREKQIVSLAVVGAGRGPLVRAALVAADEAKVNIQVYAVEKNPNAIVTLLDQKHEVWKDKVTIVSSDMRDWNPSFKFDIIVSELLGSFGDNELSPECLDGAQKFLKDDGISIPSSYTSFLSPIQSPKLYSSLSAMREKDKFHLAAYEMPYVVRLHNHKELAEPQALFTFDHPNKSKVIDNRRAKTLEFEITQSNLIHGFAGYFEATLYKNIMLSIKPSTHSPGMFSWFPIYIPLLYPVEVVKGDTVEVNFWRCHNKKNVWYEWALSSPAVTPIHNPNGRSYNIGL